jgi:hypothetical protein
VRRVTALLALVAAAMAVAAAPASAAPDGPIADRCAEVNGALVAPCYGADVLARDATAACRWTGALPDGTCSVPPEPPVSEAAIQAYRESWIHRAMGLQYALANDVGFRDAPWVGTHNSFNSIAEMGPTLSDMDSNQQLSLTDQLRIDMRSLELDVHWFPSVHEGAQRAPVVCHAQPDPHAGCSIERPLEPVLDEIAAWLRDHPGQVLLLYLEDHLDDEAGYDAGAAAVRSALGDLLYAPAAGRTASCTEIPLTLSRKDVLAAGRQVVIVSDCGAGTAWRGVAFGWSGHEETRPIGYRDFPDCGPDYPRATYDAKLVRYFEDSTWLTTTVAAAGQGEVDDGITPETAAAMARCGVDLIGLDQVLPDDGRLESLVWSWAPNEPAAGSDCAMARADGRWETRACDESHRVACRAADGSWTVPVAAVAQALAATACADLGLTFSVPRTGYENALLREAAGGSEVWLGYGRSGDGWAAADQR